MCAVSRYTYVLHVVMYEYIYIYVYIYMCYFECGQVWSHVKQFCFQTVLFDQLVRSKFDRLADSLSVVLSRRVW